MDKTLEEVLTELLKILTEINSQRVEDKKTEIDNSKFFSSIRTSLFKKLTPSQVKGMEAKLDAFRAGGYSLSWAAYAMATSYHETAARMQPVQEGLNASDAWRKKNLRYYPYYGRGDVQLTWKENYVRADKELNLQGELVNNLDLALDPAVSAKIMVKGMKEGWFTNKKLSDYLPSEEGSYAQFRNSRRIINAMDKADLIAGYAIKFQEALQLAGYGEV